jgi:hypothetical protein
MKARVPPYKSLVALVEGFLEDPNDEHEASRRLRRTISEAWQLTRIATRTAEEALTLLCLYWGLTSRYTEQLLRFIRGVPWDYDERLRTLAISIAGGYLRQNSEPSLLDGLISTFESDSDIRVHNTAYYALCEAMGHDARVGFVEDEMRKPKPDIDSAVIQVARERLSREMAGAIRGNL